MKKILIFGLPRTGTTLLENYLATNFRIPGLSEPYSNHLIKSRWIDWTKELNWGVVKVLTTSCTYQQWPIDIFQLIGLNAFDGIVITSRLDQVDICLSLYYAEQVANKYQWKDNDDVLEMSFTCDHKFVENFCKELKIFDSTITWLKSTNVQYDIFDYDKFLDGQDQYVFGSLINNQMKFKFKKSNINYKDLCQNYEEVKRMIESCI